MESGQKILAIDPSIRRLGLAVVEPRTAHPACLADFVVQFSTLVKSSNSDWTKAVDHVTDQVEEIIDEYCPSCHAVIEFPQIFGSAKGQASNNSGAVLKLTAVCFAIRALFIDPQNSVTLVPVNKWKGTLPKQVMAKRIARRWPDLKATDHNELDAVGIADWYLRKVKGYAT